MFGKTFLSGCGGWLWALLGCGLLFVRTILQSSSNVGVLGEAAPMKKCVCEL